MTKIEVFNTFCQDRTMVMANLVTVDLSSNFLTEIFSLHTGPNIGTLNMTNNRISRITGELKNTELALMEKISRICLPFNSLKREEVVLASCFSTLPISTLVPNRS